ncbi:MAG: winged helix-turn-helix domain-containing protein [Anaerolineales bacterium]|jgi:DNA-binding MarR family transcriptional regulator
MANPDESTREMALLETIERDPDVTQASIATQMDVAVGTVNWHLKRLIDKGYVKIKRANRKKLRYIITPEGIALRTRLTMDYIEQQFLLYRNTRQHVKEHIVRVRAAGFDRLCVRGDGDVAEICRLTCMEQGIEVIPDDTGPVLVVNGLHVELEGLHEH